MFLCFCVFTKSIKKKCSDIYTEIKSYRIGLIFLIPAKFSLYLSIMWINNITIVAFVWGRYVAHIDQQRYSVDILLFGRYNHGSTSYKSHNCTLYFGVNASVESNKTNLLYFRAHKQKLIVIFWRKTTVWAVRIIK